MSCRQSIKTSARKHLPNYSCGEFTKKLL